MIEVQIGEAASYAAAGVDVDAGDRLSQIWQEAAQSTYDNRKDTLIGQMVATGEGFTAFRAIDLDPIVTQQKEGLRLVGGVDGVGTKSELAERASHSHYTHWIDVKEQNRDHEGIFHDAVAMVADDIARDGGEPVAIYTIFDANSFKPSYVEPIVQQLGKGAAEACRLANIVYPNGETAELGDRIGGYGDFNYNLGAFALGAIHKTRVIDGSTVEPGDKIVALREYGFRANGMSLVRKVLAAEYGPDWHIDHEDIAREALERSLIYTPAFVEMHGGYDIDRPAMAEVFAIAHVTGGGVPGKLQRKLAVSGHGAMLDNLFPPPEIMLSVQDLSLKHAELGLDTDDANLYQSLNAGNGALIVTAEPENVIQVAEKHGFEAQLAGEITPEPGIEIKSKGLTYSDEWIRFVPRGA